MEFNAGKAYREAGYKGRCPASAGSGLLQKTDIQDEISRLIVERQRRLDLEADDVVQELTKIAFGDIGAYMNWDASGITLIAKDQLTHDQLSALSEVSEVQTAGGATTFKLKMHDKIRALELLGKHLGMWVDRHKIESEGLPVTFILPEAAAAGS